MEDVLSREGINCSIIELRVLSGNIEEISREGSFELVQVGNTSILVYYRSIDLKETDLST